MVLRLRRGGGSWNSGLGIDGDSISVNGEAEGMRGLGPIFGGRRLGEEIGYGGAPGVNADGSIVVGSAPTRAHGLSKPFCAEYDRQ